MHIWPAIALMATYGAGRVYRIIWADQDPSDRCADAMLLLWCVVGIWGLW